MSEDVTLQVAQMSVQSWADQVMENHYAAEDCSKCDDHLREGIKAYRFVEFGEMVLREAAYRGVRPWTAEIDKAIRVLYQAWSAVATEAEEWISRVQKNELDLENLKEFRECKEAVADWIETREWVDLAQPTMDRITDGSDDNSGV